MDARHCAGAEMAEMMAYAASVGSARAKRKVGAMGFIGNATDATAHYFGREHGLGTMPHALIGYAGSTAARRRDVPRDLPRRADDRAGRLFRPGGHRLRWPSAARFPDLAAAGHAVAPPRHAGGRFVEGLDPADVLRRAGAPRRPSAIRGYRSEDGAALPGRHRRLGGGDLAPARDAGRGRLPQGARSSPPPASARPSAGSWPRPRRRST